LDMKIRCLPAGFVAPAQPTKVSKPPSGADWVHEIKHDGYGLIVRGGRPHSAVLYRDAYDWAVRLPATAVAESRIKTKSFTIDARPPCWGSLR
jgi:bifunctional non-homologous end joining protein LigD